MIKKKKPKITLGYSKSKSREIKNKIKAYNESSYN